MAQGDGASFRHHSRTRSTRNHDQEACATFSRQRSTSSSRMTEASAHAHLHASEAQDLRFQAFLARLRVPSASGTEIPQTTRCSQNNKIRQNNTEDHVRAWPAGPVTGRDLSVLGSCLHSRGRAPHNLHTRQTAGRGTEKGPSRPCERRKSPCFWERESQGGPWSALGTGEW